MMTGVWVGRCGRVMTVGEGDDVGGTPVGGAVVSVATGVSVGGTGEALVTTVTTMMMGVGGGVAGLQAANIAIVSAPASPLRKIALIKFKVGLARLV